MESTKSFDPMDSLNRAFARIKEFKETEAVFLLLYTALDTRLCIERTLFEYLVLVRNTNISKAMEKLYSATDLKKEILKEEPHLFRKIEFIEVMTSFLGITKPVVPDLELLSECYGKTNNYLHAPKRPEKTWENLAWWENLQSILEKALGHLVEIHSSPIAHINLNESGEELFRRFSEGKISRSELEDEFRKSFSTQ